MAGVHSLPFRSKAARSRRTSANANAKKNAMAAAPLAPNPASCGMVRTAILPVRVGSLGNATSAAWLIPSLVVLRTRPGGST